MWSKHHIESAISQDWSWVTGETHGSLSANLTLKPGGCEGQRSLNCIDWADRSCWRWWRWGERSGIGGHRLAKELSVAWGIVLFYTTIWNALTDLIIAFKRELDKYLKENARRWREGRRRVRLLCKAGMDWIDQKYIFCATAILWFYKLANVLHEIKNYMVCIFLNG